MSVGIPIMTPERNWILFGTAAICIVITVISSTMYPLNQMGILEILAYEVLMILLILAILKLVYNRGLPDDPTYHPDN